MRYQLRYIRTRHFRGARKNISRSHPTNTNLHVSNRITYSCPTVFPATAHHLQPGARLTNQPEVKVLVYHPIR